MKPTVVKVAASMLAIGVAITGLTPIADSAYSNGVTAEDSHTARQAADAAAAARRALAANDGATAVRHAEAAVDAMPTSPEYRHLLGQSYLSAGRFASAETSFRDALTLNPELSRTAFNLALAQIAQGKRHAALSELDNLEGRIGASDLGLAVALAGEHERAIAILRQAARAGDGDPRARQNLALTYAMAGRWGEARVTASQDVSLAELNERLRDWASFAAPQDQSSQVASLLGVSTDYGDPGQPMRLALAPQDVPVRTASADIAEPESNPVVAITTPAGVTEVPVPPASESRTSVAADPDSFIVEERDAQASAPAAEIVHAMAPETPLDAETVSRGVSRTVADATPTATAGGEYVVQIGAFAVESNVEIAWSRAVERYDALARYTPQRTTVEMGRTLHRLSIGGYDQWADASRMCGTLQSVGQDCFVRARAADRPVQMAASVTADENGEGQGWFA